MIEFTNQSTNMPTSIDALSVIGVNKTADKNRTVLIMTGGIEVGVIGIYADVVSKVSYEKELSRMNPTDRNMLINSR